MSTLVSVIVPVFNAQDTIVRCLGNLLNQTLADIEILLIDDASTDNTLSILKDAQNQFPEKVRLFCQDTNHGPGAARNIGLRAAAGDYIGFVDADDMVDTSMYEKLFKKAKETGADITDCAFFRESQDRALIQFTEDMRGPVDGKKKADAMIGGFTVTKLFRRELLQAPPLYFREEYGLEDMDFLMAAIARAETLAAVDEILYVYKDSGNSLSKELDFDKYIHNHLTAMTGIFEALSSREDYAELQDAAEICMTTLFTNNLSMIKLQRKKNRISKELLSKLQKEMTGIYFSCVKKNITKNPYFENRLGDEAKKMMRELWR